MPGDAFNCVTRYHRVNVGKFDAWIEADDAIPDRHVQPAAIVVAVPAARG